MAELNEHHAEKYMKLQSDATANGKSTLANLQRMVSPPDDQAHSGGNRGAESHRQCEANLMKVQKELEYLTGLAQ